MNGIVSLIAAVGAALPSSPSTELVIVVDRMRNSKGALHACLSRQPRHFPNCRADQSALLQTVPAATRVLRFRGFPPGRYAVTLFHDENNNQRLDTVLGIPREGFGFSNNPIIRFGAPKFQQVSIELGAGYSRQSIRMQYIF